MQCIICGSSKIRTIETKISDFLVAKIYGEDEVNNTRAVNICHCDQCTFSFYDKRLTDEESDRLYEGYRGAAYQKLREKYDCWYTEKINDAMNNDSVALKEQQRVIEQMVKKHVPTNIRVALDYGGNQGDTFTDLLGTEKKYVYDISDIPVRDEGG